MKCEWCHKRDAETQVELDGEDEVRYVCKRCAERLRREAERQSEPDPADDDCPNLDPDGQDDHMQGAIDALDGMIDSLSKALGGEVEEYGEAAEEEDRRRYRTLPLGKGNHPFRYCGLLHLEGMFLIGELEQAKRVVQDSGMKLVPVKHAGMMDAGHAFSVAYGCRTAEARDVVGMLIDREMQAREILREELTRLYMDAAMRALAILQSAKLLAPDELFDLISPLKLAAHDGILRGIGADELEELAMGCDMKGYKKMKDDARNETDARRADEMNARFGRVRLDWNGELK